MKPTSLIVSLVMCLCLLVGCATTTSGERLRAPDLSLDEAKALIVSGQVRSIFQPHQGCVVLEMKDNRYLSFDQPHLDWVLSFVEEQGLRDAIPISME